LSSKTLKSVTAPLHRIGAVSKLTGIPVSTLRIWEIRYSAFAPVYSAGKHRLFESADVKKAGLLKTLNEAGHVIRNIANLPNESLELLARQALASTGLAKVQESKTQLVVAVVGSGLGMRIDLQQLLLKPSNASIELSDAFTDLGSALAAEFTKNPEVLIVKINTLNAVAREQMDALNARFGLRRTIVLCNYGPQALIQAMRSAGMLVRRLPIIEDELADLVSSEEYSQECLSNSAEDAHLHAYLKSVSGSARAMFERALEIVAEHEGISLLA
jgi:MerR family transcriptional regulator, light-induced transcriptional regulator